MSDLFPKEHLGYTAVSQFLIGFFRMSIPNFAQADWTADLGRQIKTARKRCKYPQQKLANALGVSSESLRLYEAGKVPVSLETLRIIVHELQSSFAIGEMTISPSSFAPVVSVAPAEQAAFDFYNEYHYVGATVRISVSKERFQVAGYLPPKVANG